MPGIIILGTTGEFLTITDDERHAFETRRNSCAQLTERNRRIEAPVKTDILVAETAAERKLEQAGAHVVYGLVGLKTHSKVCLVVRREGTILRRYVHIGTGNYNPKTARVYVDLGLLTVRPELGADATETR